MKILPADETGITAALEVLRQGGVVAHATETCYGLACDLSSQQAVAKLFAAKQRPADQPVSALFASLEQAKEYVAWNDAAQALADQHLPGPLTIILPLTPNAPHTLYPCSNPSPNPSIGIRLSSHPLAQALAEQFGSPLSTTSANLHSQPNPYSIGDMQDQGLACDLMLDSGQLPEAPPSTVIRLVDDQVIILRQGPTEV